MRPPGFKILNVHHLLCSETHHRQNDSVPNKSPVYLPERGKTLVQNKPTMYLTWKATFDAHIYEGRVLEVVLMQSNEEPLAKATMGMSVLAERCKKSKSNSSADFWLDLLPSGRVQMVVQYYLEDGDVGKTRKKGK